MDRFFIDHPYEPVGGTDFVQDVELALYLVSFFKTSYDANEGVWRGQDLLTTVRATCHVLDVLHLLGFPVLGPDVLETATTWLINLPGLDHIAAEEEERIRLYPSRFKTLISHGILGHRRVCTDFGDLHSHLSEDGLISGVMVRPLLATLIYVDCARMLAQSGALRSEWRSGLDRGLDAIMREVGLWHQHQKDYSGRSKVWDIGDLSYAVDVLLRNDMLGIGDELVQAAYARMCQQIDQQTWTEPISSDTLYCGIQLRAHFPDDPVARAATQSLIHDIRVRYQQVNLDRETDFFHALVLRLLCAHHGEALRQGLALLLMERYHQNLAFGWQSEEQKDRERFAGVIGDRLSVKVDDAQPLSGGITEARVFRVEFCFEFAAASEGGGFRNPVRTFHPDPNSLVIKRDTLDRIRRSIRQYEQLPDTAKPFFARHVGQPQAIRGDASGLGFLVLEDLTYMITLRDVLNRLDQGMLSVANADRIERACGVICDAAFAIYDDTKRDATHFFGTQLFNLYLSRIEASLTMLTRHDGFPQTKPWLSGFMLDNRRFLSAEHYLNKVTQYRAVLRVPFLGLVHGDFHSRNIMLDETLRHMKLVDLDHVTDSGDYIADFACLLEDVSVFRFLTDPGFRFRLDMDKVLFPSGTDQSDGSDISYPAVSSEAVRHFQRCLLARMEDFAEEIEDVRWKERLWLALASGLFQVAARQRGVRRAAVAFVEGVKLLDDLVSHLSRDEMPLGEIPFPDRHRGGVELLTTLEPDQLPAWCQPGTVLGELHRRLVQPEMGLRFKLVGSGSQYFRGNRALPVTVIDAKREKLLLPCRPEGLRDPKRLASSRETEGEFHTSVVVSMDVLDEIVGFVEQVLD